MITKLLLKSRACYLMLFMALAGLQSAGAQIAQFNFPATSSLVVSAKNPNVTVSNMAATTGSITTNVVTGDYFPNEPYIESSGGWSASAQATAKGFRFTITAAANYTINITGISYNFYSTAAGPSAVGATINSTSVTSQDAPNSVMVPVSQIVTGQNGLTSAVITIQGWNNGSRSTNGTGVFRLDDVIITGTVTPPNNAPVASAVGLSGVTEVGQTLTGSYTYSDTENNPEGTSVYKWYRADNGLGANAAVIPGATAQTYQLTTADIGKFIRFSVTPAATAGTSPGAESFSAYMGPVSTGADALSTITVDESFTPSSNVNYLNSQGTNVTGSSHAFARFSLNDVLDGPGDGLPTVLTGITFGVTGASNLESVALYDSLNNEIAEVAAGTSVTFNGINITAASGTSEVFTLRATFKPNVTDNAQPQFTVTAASVDVAGSFFASPAAGGAATSVTADQNRIEVSASKLIFTQEPSNTIINGGQTVVVAAVDANNNLDTDFTGSVILTSNGVLSAVQMQNAVSGVATFTGVTHTVVDPAVILLASSIGLTPAASAEFAIVVQEAGVLLAEENFDYTGTLITNGYTNISGSGQNVITTSTGSLAIANYGSVNVGNKITLANTGEDVSKSVPSQNGNYTVYGSMLVSVASASSTGDYFFALLPTGSTSLLRARLFVRSQVPGTVEFGIGHGSAPATWSSAQPVNTPVNLVVKYQKVSSNLAIASLFVNPDLYSEPAVPTTTVNEANSANILNDVSSYVIRQGGTNTAPVITIDGIRIATNWGTALGNPQYDTDATINAGHYNSIMALNGTVTAAGNLFVNSALTVDSGVLDMNDKTLTPATDAVISIEGSLATSNPNGLTGSANATISNANVYSFTANGTIIYNGDDAQSISAMTYGSLELQGAGDKSFAGDTTVNDVLTHNSAGDVTVPTGTDLTVNGQILSTGEGEFIVENNANLLQSGDFNTNVGPITVKRDASMRRLEYVYWSSPVAGQELQSFSPMTLANRFYEIDETTNSFAPANPLNAFATAKGYAVRAPNDFLDAPAAPQLFNGSFSGIPNNGEYTIPVTNTPGTGLGFNLIGNPYPSPIDAQLFLNANAHIGTLYFWTHQNFEGGGVNYAMFNGTGEAAAVGGEAPNGFIQTGQGFLVYAGSSANAIFTNAMRTGDNTGQFFRNSNSEKHRIWIDLAHEGQSVNQALIGYIENATDNADLQYDGIFFPSEASRITSLIGSQEFGIQGKALPFVNSDIVPLGFTASANGNYSISINDVDGLFADGQDIFIRDNMTGTVHNLQDAYTFASAAGTFNNRFEILYQFSPLGIDDTVINDNNVVVYKQNGQLNINTGNNLMDAVKVFDVRGRMIYENNKVNASSTSFGMNASQQMLVVQITANGKTVSKKVVY